ISRSSIDFTSLVNKPIFAAPYRGEYNGRPRAVRSSTNRLTSDQAGLRLPPGRNQFSFGPLIFEPQTFDRFKKGDPDGHASGSVRTRQTSRERGYPRES